MVSWMQDAAADLVTNVARKFLTAMSVKTGTMTHRDSIWQKIESMVDNDVDGRQLDDLDKPRSTSDLWASAGGVLHTFCLLRFSSHSTMFTIQLRKWDVSTGSICIPCMRREGDSDIGGPLDSRNLHARAKGPFSSYFEDLDFNAFTRVAVWLGLTVRFR